MRGKQGKVTKARGQKPIRREEAGHVPWANKRANQTQNRWCVYQKSSKFDFRNLNIDVMPITTPHKIRACPVKPGILPKRSSMYFMPGRVPP
jgi:hypothetical protein